MITLKSKLYTHPLLGGERGTTRFDDILQWNQKENEWIFKAKMTKIRAFHAVSLIEFDENMCSMMDVGSL